jgi:hypothetical protein
VSIDEKARSQQVAMQRHNCGVGPPVLCNSTGTNTSREYSEVHWRTFRDVTAASRSRLARSAPVSPSHAADDANVRKSTPSAMGDRAHSAVKIAPRPAALGSGTYSVLSKRPGRRRAGSIMSGRFVAASTNTAPRDSVPSNSVRSWFTTLQHDCTLQDCEDYCIATPEAVPCLFFCLCSIKGDSSGQVLSNTQVGTSYNL